MKNINWKIRFKKKSFWVAIVSAIVLFVNNITQALGLNYTEQLEQFSDGINGLLAVLVTFGVINDPTTKGMKDSGIAQTYSKPRDEQVDPVEYQSEGNTFTPKEYDTREDFSDDSDEIDFYSTLADGGQHPDDAKHLEDEEQPEDDTDEGLGQRGVDNGKD
ncbi:phage holin [Staphylococcus saprophyticus]|nr:phage holin [Staphylococcus saprophyticus]